MSWRDYLVLWQLARRRLKSEEDYRRFQAFQASLLIGYLQENGVRLEGRVCLDLGSGIGGYSQEFACLGAHVICIDLMQPHRLVVSSIAQVIGNAMAIPLRDEVMDFVFCASLIEHVAQPERLLAEIERVLRRGGMSYVSFPPYYSLRGGHEFSPFHYAGERLALRLARRRALPDWARQLYGTSTEIESFSSWFKDWGLYKMTIGRFRSLLKRSRLQCVNMSTRYLPVSLVHWPFLGEILTWHAQFLLLKPSPLRDDLPL